MKIAGVIPARMSATRFPGKPLADIAGRPMISWVLESARGVGLDSVVVATPDVEIASVVRSLGGKALMTSDEHETGSDRVAEAAEALSDHDVIVNIQGDQPFIDKLQVHAAVRPFVRGDAVPMATIGCAIRSPEAFADPNVVKVVVDVRGRALYFSRRPIPYGTPAGGDAALHHVGLYAYDRKFLMKLSTLRPTPLERAEGLEQLRVLEHGFDIAVERAPGTAVEVNVPDDIDAAERYLEERRSAGD